MEADIELTTIMKKITVSEAVEIITSKLFYIVFGSLSSTDLDVVVWIPLELTRHTYMHRPLCLELDKIIYKKDQTKTVNSCLAYWDLNFPNKLLWCQVGTLAQAWNSYLTTENFHPQMYLPY